MSESPKIFNNLEKNISNVNDNPDLSQELRKEVIVNNEEIIKSPFIKGEVFDPQFELLRLKNFHGEEGLEKLHEYKDKLRFQKNGLISIHSKILNYLDNQDNLAEKKIYNLIADDLEKYALTNEQRQAFDKSIKKFVERNKAIKETIAPFQTENGIINGEKLYESVFKRKPEGRVEVIVNSYSIYFRIANIIDYSYVVSGAYKKNRSLKEADLELAAMSGGAKINSHPNRKLNGLIAIENAVDSQDPTVAQEVLTHERQHVINDVLQKYFTMADQDENYRLYSNLQKSGEINTKEDEDAFVLLRRENLEIENKIKDEIFAYFKGGKKSKKISEMLLADDTMYNYVYSYNLNEDDDFDLEYLNLVENGLVAFTEFLNRGYSVNETISLLLPEPLIKWPKTLSRMTDYKMEADDWHKKKKNYIDGSILERDSLIKEGEGNNDEE